MSSLQKINPLSDTGVRRRRRKGVEKKKKVYSYEGFKARYKDLDIFEDREVFNYAQALRREFEPRRAKISDFKNVEGVDSSHLKVDQSSLKRKSWRIGQSRLGDRSNSHNRELEDIAEYLIMKVISDNILVPDDVEVIPGSQYDDFYNAVDLIVSVYDKKRGDFKWSFSIDVKTSQERLESSMDRTLDYVTSGKFSKAKYFQYKKNINNKEFDHKINFYMPNFILFFPKEELKALLVFLAKEKANKSKRLKKEVYNRFRKSFFVAIKDWAKTIVNIVENNLEHIHAPDWKIDKFLKQYKGVLRWCNKYLDKDDELKDKYKF